MTPLPPRDLDREGGEPPGSGFPPSESLKTPPGEAAASLGSLWSGPLSSAVLAFLS